MLKAPKEILPSFINNGRKPPTLLPMMHTASRVLLKRKEFFKIGMGIVFERMNNDSLRFRCLGSCLFVSACDVLPVTAPPFHIIDTPWRTKHKGGGLVNKRGTITVGAARGGL